MAFSKNKLIAVFFSFFLFSCSGNSCPVPTEYVHLYAEMRIAEREYGETSPEGRIVRVEILKKYGYSRVRFDSVAECIQKNYQAWDPFQTQVSEYIDSLAIAASAVPSPIKADPERGRRNPRPFKEGLPE
ncbi:MAG: hypothetical protein M0P13_08470 [Fibrobacteraceae bacterium]|nr:hypothetical protein [Fibrobacteraceae bacterium]